MSRKTTEEIERSKPVATDGIGASGGGSTMGGAATGSTGGGFEAVGGPAASNTVTDAVYKTRE
jgi:hypothetical protein